MYRVPSRLDAVSMMRITSTHSSLCCGTIDCDAGDMQISHQEPARGWWDLFITPVRHSLPETPLGAPLQVFEPCPRLANDDPPWLTFMAEIVRAICFGCGSDVSKSEEKLAAIQASHAMQAAKAKVIGTSLHEHISCLARTNDSGFDEDIDLVSILAVGATPAHAESLPALASPSSSAVSADDCRSCRESAFSPAIESDSWQV